jgi:transposase-like protein
MPYSPRSNPLILSWDPRLGGLLRDARDVCKDTVSAIIGRVVAELTRGRNRPLDRVHPAVVIDAAVAGIGDPGRRCPA